MKFFKNIKLISTMLGAFIASGCAVVPEPIEVGENTILVPFEAVQSGILLSANDQVVGDGTNKARWGGKIVSVVNKKDVSEIEVVFFPEGHLGKPKTGMPSAGRFKAIVQGFVDPIVFEQGRLITVVGEVGSSVTGIIGEQEYVYPSLNAKGYYMWRETTDVNVEIDNFAFSPFGYRAGFNNSFFYPWYDPWYRTRQRGRVRIERYNGHSQGSSVNSSTSSRVSSGVTQTSQPRQVTQGTRTDTQER